MSRTVHHVPVAHWNQREQFTDHRTGLPYEGDSWGSSPVGNVLYDLRFHAGCRRVPQRLRHEVSGGGYIHGHGGTDAVGRHARETEAGLRNGWRAFAAESVKAYRAGVGFGGMVEPDGRTRHEAIWDCF